MKNSTREKIMAEGKKEFLAKGYKDASLRKIVKEAGVTTGAFYGYFSDKEQLFEALVSPFAENLSKKFEKSLQGFNELPDAVQISSMHRYSREGLRKIIDYIYENYDAVKLLICCSDGTKYEHYMETLIEKETESSLKFIKVAERNGYPTKHITKEICHMLAAACYNGIFEIIVHDMPKKTAREQIDILSEFFHVGWDSVLGLN